MGDSNPSCTPSPYERGYRLGYRIEKTFERSLALGLVAKMDVERQLPCDSSGRPFDPHSTGQHWLGYTHGRHHGRTGVPPPAARNRVPDPL